MLHRSKGLLILFSLLLLCCKDEERNPSQAQGCAAACELQREEFERLTTEVYYRLNELPFITMYINKTPSGVHAIYVPWFSDRLEAELSAEEWQDFIKSLHKYLHKDFGICCGYGRYGKEDERYSREEFYGKFSIYYKNEAAPDKRHRWETGPSDWAGVERLMGGIVSKMRERAPSPFEAELRAKYQERFGEPITDLELSMRAVDFWIDGSDSWNFSVEKRSTEGFGATICYKRICNIAAELGIGDWLDFVRGLRKSGVGELENKYGEKPSDGEWDKVEKWGIKIYSYGRLNINLMLGFGVYPPRWDEIKKVMEDMAKVINKNKRKCRRCGPG